MRNKFLKTLLLMLVAFFAIVLVGCGNLYELKTINNILNSNLSSKLPNIKNINEVYVYVGNTTVERKIFEFKGIKICIRAVFKQYI